ncbi:MAG TPA: hypothetical protein VFM34_05120 [Moraxellaceae bacterium]|nr:hypothetical protein [Moraxellaceae bacterium]
MAFQVQTILLWLASFFEDEKGNTSAKRLLFIACGFTFLGMCIGLAIAVASDAREASGVLQLLIVTVGTMATGGYLGGKAIEKKSES